MKESKMRGVLTDEIEKKYGITRKQLRLLPYLQFCLLNCQVIDPLKTDKEEKEILKAWREEGKIDFSVGTRCSCTKEFWDWMCGALYLGYVPELGDEEG